MLPAVVQGRDFDVLVVPPTILIAVLDTHVRKVHLAVEVRQVPIACPIFDLRLVAIRAAVVV